MRVLNCQLTPNTMTWSQKERQGDCLTHFRLSKTPWEDGFTNIVTRQPDWWLSKSHWNHVRLFKGSKLFQESGSHCQCFGLCLRTCDWFVNRQRPGPNHASLQRTPLRPAGSRTNDTYARSDSHGIAQAHSCVSELHAGQLPTVIKTRLLWRHRHHANTHTGSHTHVHTYLSPQDIWFVSTV